MVSNPVVEREQTMRRGVENRHGRHSLRRREHVDDRVLFPRSTGLWVGGATPQINDELVVDHRRTGRTHLAPSSEVVLEDFTYAFKTRLDRASNMHLTSISHEARTLWLLTRHAVP